MSLYCLRLGVILTGCDNDICDINIVACCGDIHGMLEVESLLCPLAWCDCSVTCMKHHSSHPKGAATHTGC